MKNKFSQMTDEQLYLIMAGKGKDGETAFAELYSRFSTPVYRYIQKFMDDSEQADDIYQETFIRFYNCRDKDKTMTNVFAFVYTIARNLCLTAKARRRPTISIDEDFEIPYNDKSFDNEELSDIVAEALDILPDNFREALVLQVYNDMSYQEISEIMEVPVTTVRNWIVRGKKKIREVMGTYLQDYRKD